MYKHVIHVSLFLLWVFILAFSLWWYQFRWITTADFSPYAASFSVTATSPEYIGQSGVGKTVVLHFIDNNCPCNRFSTPHIRELETAHTNKVAHVKVIKGEHQIMYSEAVSHLLTQVPASPSVAIWAPSGRLAYFGPYSLGAVCGRGKDMVAYTLENIHNDEFSWVNQEAIGCLCPWQPQRENSDRV